jgi:tricarballylate dehydrogenase
MMNVGRTNPMGADRATDPIVADVLVIGGGNAGMCAAITARGDGVKVLVLERSPRTARGGNSRHTRNMRCAHDAPTSILSGSYPEEEYAADLMRVTKGRMDPHLAQVAIRASAKLPEWLMSLGVRFQPPYRGTLHLGRTNAFFLGGGKALLNSEYAAAESRGVRILYDAEVFALDIVDGCFRSARVRIGGRESIVLAKAVVLAAGGFEANLDWLKEAWGDIAENFIVRGSPSNDGLILKLMLAQDAQPVSDATQCHAVAVDARAPKFDGGIVTRIDCISLGIVVNSLGQRFYDEGEDFWPKRYAIWGRLVAREPGQIAYAIIDAKAVGRFMPTLFPPAEANTIRGLADLLGLPAEVLDATVLQFNRSICSGTYDHDVLDDCTTVGLSPAKSHWALPLDTPPFLAYPLRPGITFTYLGVKVDATAKVLLRDGSSFLNVFAAGEIMAGNVLGEGYAAGVGMMLGAAFGRLAGTGAAALCNQRN